MNLHRLFLMLPLLLSAVSCRKEPLPDTYTEWKIFNDCKGGQIVFGNGRFAALDSNGIVHWSKNGKIWNSKRLAAKEPFQSLIYGNGRFAAVNIHGSAVAVSKNGKDWEIDTIELSSPRGIDSLSFQNSRFTIYYSRENKKAKGSESWYSTLSKSSRDGVHWGEECDVSELQKSEHKKVNDRQHRAAELSKKLDDRDGPFFGRLLNTPENVPLLGIVSDGLIISKDTIQWYHLLYEDDSLLYNYKYDSISGRHEKPSLQKQGKYYWLNTGNALYRITMNNITFPDMSLADTANLFEHFIHRIVVPDSLHAYSIAFGNGIYTARTPNGFIWSQDGEKWNHSNVFDTTSITFVPEDILWDGEKFCGIQYDTSINEDGDTCKSYHFATSEDGIHWKKTPENVPYSHSKCSAKNGWYFQLGLNLGWYKGKSVSVSYPNYAVCLPVDYIDGYYQAVYKRCVSLISSDGKKWKLGRAGSPTPLYQKKDNELFLSNGNGGWERLYPPIEYDSIAVSSSKIILYSWKQIAVKRFRENPVPSDPADSIAFLLLNFDSLKCETTITHKDQLRLQPAILDIPQIPYPTFPKSGKKITSFVPSGWTITNSASGDLNGDGITDAALILMETAVIKPPLMNEEPHHRTVSLVLMGTKTSSYKLFEVNKEFVPVDDAEVTDHIVCTPVSIKKRKLIFEFYSYMAAGSWMAEDYSYTFSYDPKGMVLNAEYYRSYMRNGGEYHIIKGDYQNGIQTFIRGDDYDEENLGFKKRVVHRKFPKTYLKNIGSYQFHASRDYE